METLLICVSVSNGNTRRVADRMADVLGAEATAERFIVSSPKGCEVLDSFSCRGLGTVGPLRLVGGVNKGRPNDADLDRAAVFATQLRERVEQSESALWQGPH